MRTVRILLVSTVFAASSLTVSAQQDLPEIALPDFPDSNSIGPASEIELGTPVHIINPVVPKKFRNQHAVAVLQATTQADGTFDSLSYLGGDRGLEESSLDAVRQWQYSPATLNGSPVQTQVFVIIDPNKSKLNTRLELDTPFPTKPKTPLEDQIAERLLFKSDPRRMHPPKVLYQPDPEYSEAARYAKFQGMLVLGMIVGRDGDPKDVWVVKKLGLGLDQKAIESVQTWKFAPATKDGEPIPVTINVEVTFRLY